jgi:branched-chain amino acid transport system permease protein
VVEVLQLAVNVLSLGGLYAMLALGLALIFSILRLINFAYGELIMIAGYSALFLLAAGAPLLAMILPTLALVALTSIVMERVAFRPVRGADAATLLITSFAVSVFIQNLASLTISPRPRGLPIPAQLTEVLTVGPLRIPPLEAVTAVTAIIVLVALTAFLNRTSLGVQLRAAAEDFEMVRILGVRANRVVAAAFALSGGLAGIAGLLWLARTANVSPTAGSGPLLIAFIAIVVGGMGSLRGAVAGGFLLAALTIALQRTLPTELLGYRNAFVFGILILILLLRPRGLFGVERAESL